MSRPAFIVDYVRTPIGRYGGRLAPVRPDDLAAVPLRALMDRNTAVDWATVDDVLFGAINQAGEDNRNVARMASLLAGLPETVPGSTTNRLCGSGMQTIIDAARAVALDEADLIIAGGVESMSRAPFVVPKAETAYPTQANIASTTLGWRLVNPKMQKLGHTDALGVTAENVAAEYNVSREDQDAFALRSQMRWAAAAERGVFEAEVVPVAVPRRKADPDIVDIDEHPRPTTSIEALQRLRPAFREGGSVTAGNSSGINDAAAAVIVASEAAVEANGFEPIARVVTSTVAGVPPRIMGIGPIPATEKLLARTGLSIGDMDVIEL
ncbi:MAG: acetyl-CoA C-acyltransferase, partial [bacterium]|nr:acetyl-CoA C-acyltransferase [bacterium]